MCAAHSSPTHRFAAEHGNLSPPNSGLLANHARASNINSACLRGHANVLCIYHLLFLLGLSLARNKPDLHTSSCWHPKQQTASYPCMGSSYGYTY
jgi:hypothetical protein